MQQPTPYPSLGRGVSYLTFNIFSMKKIYLTPATEIAFVQVTSMLAESLPISDDTVNGGDALTKENAWDIWAE